MSLHEDLPARRLVRFEHADLVRPSGVWRDDGAITVHESEIVCLVGPNGGGKSLTLRALAGELPLASSRGIVLPDSYFSANIRREPGLSARDALAPHAAQNAASDALVRCGIEPTTQTEALSAGQLQRLRLAGALASGRRLILLDAPTAQIDSEGADLVEAAIVELAEVGAGLVVATTDADLIIRLPRSTIYTVGDGRITLMQRVQ